MGGGISITSGSMKGKEKAVTKLLNSVVSENNRFLFGERESEGKVKKNKDQANTQAFKRSERVRLAFLGTHHLANRRRLQSINRLKAILIM